MTRTGLGKGQSTPAASGWSAEGTVTAYAAAIAAFAYALVDLYWALGGRALLSTVGGYVEQFAGRGGALPVLVALAATAAKVAGGLIALALVRPWGRVVPRGWLMAGSAGASVLLVGYGGVYVLLEALVLSDVIHPGGSMDRTALRWHVAVWDLWFLVWGILLALATVGYWRRTATGLPRDAAANRANNKRSRGRRPNLPVCCDSVRHLEHEPELDVLRVVPGSSGAIARRAESAFRSLTLWTVGRAA